MKKIYLLFTTFILGAALFAEQPFFLKNWIVPENVVWGEKNTIPLIDGASFKQGWEDSGLQFLEIENSEESVLNFPPYLLENNLASWNMTYEQILDAFKASDEFDVYEDVTADYDYYEPEGNVTFNDAVVAVAKEDRSFEIYFYFGDLKNESEKKEVKPVLFSIKYYNQAGTNNAIAYWDSNTELEKTIIALTAFSSCATYYVPTVFDCSIIEENISDKNRMDAKTRLADSYKPVTNKQELYNKIETDIDYLNRSYEEQKSLLKKYPKKEPFEIAELNNLKYDESGEMYYLKAMEAKIGKNNLLFEELSEKLSLLRLGVGAGFITREEAFKKARPYVDQLLSMFSSFEDFAVHNIMYDGYTTVDYSYSLFSVSALASYNRIKKQMRLEEIKFNGKKRGDKNITTIKEAFYKPQTDNEIYWIKLAKEIIVYPSVKNLPLIKEGISKYGELKIFNNLIKQIQN